MVEYYDHLLEICGWQKEEVEQERPRIEKAFQRLEIGPEDVETAQNWVSENHDVGLAGVRMLLRAWIVELIDMVLAKEEGKKLIYFAFPAFLAPVFLIAASAANTYVGSPDMVLCHVMGRVFRKLKPLLEAGEQHGIPPGHGLCSLWQVKVGMLVKGIMPPPDMGIAGGYFCDMGCKADGFLEWKYGIPIVYLDGSMDSEWGEFPDFKPERVELLGAEANHLFQKAREIAGIEVRLDPDVMAKANSFREYYLRLIQLNELIMGADPLPVSAADTSLAMLLASGCTGRGVTEGYKALDVFIQETQKRIDAGFGILEKGAPKVMMLIGNVADASIIHMIEDAGLAVSTTLFNLFPYDLQPKAAHSTLGEMLADVELQLGLYHSSFGTLKRAEWGTEQAKVDGFIWNYQFNCRPAAIMSHDMKKWVEETRGIPTLCLENDIYDPRSYSAAAMRTRVETFAQMLRARKASTSA